MKKNPGLVALLDALAQQTRMRGGSPSVQEIEKSAELVRSLLSKWQQVQCEAVAANATGACPALAQAVLQMHEVMAELAGEAA